MYFLLIILSFSTPLIIFIIGLIFYKFPPKNINSIAGYRTKRSMKNAETWREANRYSARLIIKFSFIVLLIIAIGVISAGKSYDGLAVVTMISIALTVTLLIVMILLTEKHLKA